MANLLIFVVCLINHVSLHLSASQTITRVVTTTYGPVTGVIADLPTNKTVQRFLGIPFAKAGRLEYPGPPKAWNSILHANVINKICPQLMLTIVDRRRVSLMNEDCLLLNVFAPQNASSGSLLPVMLWIHGGGYIVGDTIDYDGSVLATEGEVIVVTAAYRLGALGFLSTDSDDLRGNYGLMDQIEAMKWINKNIVRFGGDPNRVTIFGESAGGMSVALLMLSPLASGLYQNVIMQSGTAVSMYSALERRKANVKARSFAKALGCDDMASLKACVKNKQLIAIGTAQSQVPDESNYPNFAPVVDGYVLPDSPAKLLQEGRFNVSNIIVGVTRDDGSVMVSSFPGVDDRFNVTEAGMSRTLFKTIVKNHNWVPNQGEHQVEAIIYEYTDWSNVSDLYATRKQFIDLGTDSMFKAPAVLSASGFIGNAASTYFYQLEIAPKKLPGLGNEVKPFYGIFHGADVFYAFGYPLVAPKGMTTDTEIKFAKDFITLWTNFAKTGNPNQPVPLATNWPQYTADKEEYMGLGQNITVRSKMRPSKMAFWNEFIASLQSKAPPETTSALPTTPGKKDGKETLVIVLAVLTGLFGAAVLILLVVMVATSRNQKRRQQSKDFELPLKGAE